MPSSGGDNEGLINDNRILDKRDRTVTTSWTSSNGIWFSASLVWRWRWLLGGGAAAVLAPPPMTRRGGGARGGEVAPRAGCAARARRVERPRAARFGESRPSGGRGRCGALGRGCPSEKEMRRGVVGSGSRFAGKSLPAPGVRHAPVAPGSRLPLV